MPGGRDTPGQNRGIHSNAGDAYWDNTRVVSLDERNTGTETGYARGIETDRDKAGLKHAVRKGTLGHNKAGHAQ